MRNYIKRSIAVCFLAITITACSSNNYLNSEQLHYLEKQATRTLQEIPKGAINIPRNVNNGADKWRYVDYEDWTSGFWPGVLWYLFEATNQEKWKIEADKFTRELTRLSVQKAVDHDLGFQIFNSFGNGYRLTHNEEYKKVILRTADSLATLFNPNTGTILSWPRSVPNLEWPQHNTIMDNMINLEMLFWASKNGGGRELYDMAVSHAQVTMKNAFRPDYSSYHVVVYDRNTGKKIKAVTHQGYSDESMWARGQAWAIYGFTMCYRESKRSEFLEFAQKVTDVYLERLPPDLIPYWDFNDPGIPNAPKDASAAAITASAMLELSTFVADKVKASLYRKKAEQILAVLSSDKYLSKDTNSSFLLHSTGHKPNGLEIDASITYADYYYIEALIRADRLQRSEPLK
ncbi:MAG TPA: glycoside hydrolase family 88 protein [Pedobacter sp.]|uniref:glycoside hydrolase family 88 protein n=1 Tax=Pedobacter sp. TaxID=1411316 RepID=UPI002C742E7D|nr:glycoside hydrolase family 88 protein [Pedobacter sp.]HMI04190.1 glycoside hydrolase family 88 protein [Pedobacter sp.]